MEEVYPRQVKTDLPEVFLHQHGAGRVVYFPWDIDRVFWEVLCIDHSLLLRNAVLAVGAGLLTLAPTSRELGIMDGVVGAFALIALIVLYQTMDQLLENASALREWNSTHD